MTHKGVFRNYFSSHYKLRKTILHSCWPLNILKMHDVPWAAFFREYLYCVHLTYVHIATKKNFLLWFVLASLFIQMYNSLR